MAAERRSPKPKALFRTSNSRIAEPHLQYSGVSRPDGILEALPIQNQKEHWWVARLKLRELVDPSDLGRHSTGRLHQCLYAEAMFIAKREFNRSNFDNLIRSRP
jgi:hypothetical protein